MDQQPEHPATESPRFCRRCGYELRGLPTPRCPECGRAFDPANPPARSGPVRPTGTRHRFRRRMVVGVILVVGSLAVAVSGIFTWSPLNCTQEEVDIRTGRLRYTWYLLYCKVSQRVEDSPLTTALLPKAVKSVEPDWHLVNTFSPFTHRSPHYVFHGAVAEIREVAAVWDMAPFQPDAKRQIAQTVITLWQRDGSEFCATEYIESLGQLACERATKNIEKTTPVTVEDLPQPTTQRMP